MIVKSFTKGIFLTIFLLLSMIKSQHIMIKSKDFGHTKKFVIETPQHQRQHHNHMSRDRGLNSEENSSESQTESDQDEDVDEQDGLGYFN